MNDYYYKLSEDEIVEEGDEVSTRQLTWAPARGLVGEELPAQWKARRKLNDTSRFRLLEDHETIEVGMYAAVGGPAGYFIFKVTQVDLAPFVGKTRLETNLKYVWTSSSQPVAPKYRRLEDHEVIREDTLYTYFGPQGSYYGVRVEPQWVGLTPPEAPTAKFYVPASEPIAPMWRKLEDHETITKGCLVTSLGFRDEPYEVCWCGKCSPGCGMGLTVGEYKKQYFTTVDFHAPAALPVAPLPKATNKVDPGDGYRLLLDGEIIEKGDEVLRGDKWMTTMVAGAAIGDFMVALPYRRKVATPKEKQKYIFLELGDIIKEGDEFFNDAHGGWVSGWRPTICPTGYHRVIESDPMYRRKVV